MIIRKLCSVLKISLHSLKHHRNMSVFMKKVNPVTGKTEWELQDEQYDYHQEIARSGYADMLHDTERNAKYQEALEAAIIKMHREGKEAHVLDIGTGTGLLSLMAARAGADSIFACEAFEPMGECAVEVIRRNGFGDRIKVIPKRSTELTVGENGDLPRKANILVTEVFDTELIGEGAYSTFSHAHRELLEKDCIVVPSSGTVYAQVVESKLVTGWNSFRNVFYEGKKLIDTPEEILECPGAAAVHDIQLSQLSHEHFKTIIGPEPIFRFDFSGRSPLIRDRASVQVTKAQADGKAQAVFMWWDLVMDTEGKVILSCAPYWAHPSKPKSFAEIPWRDHWMQAVYYLPREVEVTAGQEVTLIGSHDEYSLWFNVGLDLKIKDKDYERPVCSCGAHVALCRTKIGQLNDEPRTAKYLQALASLINEDSVCLSLTDFSLLGIAAAKMGAKKVYCVESNALARAIIELYVLHNNVADKVVILEEPENDGSLKDKLPDKGTVNVILSEPYHFSSILAWENLHFWYLKSQVKALLSPDCRTFPVSAKVYGLAVEFADLWKIRAPLNVVQGFGMHYFDELIEKASDQTDDRWEAQPLWEYPCRALSEPIPLLHLNFNQSIPETPIKNTGSLLMRGDGKCNGIALWVDWDIDGKPEHIITTGPTEVTEINKQVKWDMHTRQGVYFIPENNIQCKDLVYCVKFHPKSGFISFKFRTLSDEVLSQIQLLQI